MDSFLPVHRKVGATLAAGFVAFLGWAVFGELDIVATAQGKLVPVNFVKVSQPSEGGPVRKVLVKDGTQVAAGQPLIELDPVYAEQDLNATHHDLARVKLQLARIAAELDNVAFVPPTDITDEPAAVASVLAEYTARRQAFNAALGEAQAAQTKAAADLLATTAKRDKAKQLAQLSDKQAGMLERLYAVGFISENALIDKLRDRADTALELQAQSHLAEAAAAGLKQAQMTVTRVTQDYRRQLTVERTDALTKLGQLQADAEKRAHRSEQTVLKAPVAGTVNGLTIHGEGQVVAAGATVLSIVPANEPLRFEGWLKNEDVAFAIPGMPVKVKLAAYPFQKYGWVEGELTWLGVDSETPESMRTAAGEPLFYRVRVVLQRQALSKDGEALALKPGLVATGDIQLGKRSLLEYLTSPVRKTLLEAAREH